MMRTYLYSLNNVDPAAVRLSLANGQMFYSTFEMQTNIWMAERQQPTTRP